MSNITTREVRLASRPTGVPTAGNFTLAETTLDPVQDGQVLVRNRFMSVDPYMRGRMNDRKSYVSPFEIGKVLDGGGVGEVIYISGAAGAVGNVAGQLAKLRGCRVIGSAGSEEKVKHLLEECGFDAAFNYKTGPVLEQLNDAAPDGIDVYFDNVGGESLEAALSALRVNGRIIACGGISGYNEEAPKPGPSNLFNMTTKRLTMKGMIVGDWLHRQSEFEKEVGAHYQAGRLKSLETVVDGLDQAVGAFIGLFEGKNVGKMVVKL